MSKGIVIGLILLAGCFYDVDGRNNIIISADGTTVLGFCSYTTLATCVQEHCPDGSYTLKDASKVVGDAVIRCLPPASK